MDDFLTPGKIDPNLKGAYEKVKENSGQTQSIQTTQTNESSKQDVKTNDETAKQINEKQAQLERAYQNTQQEDNQDTTPTYTPNPNDYSNVQSDVKEEPSVSANNDYFIKPSLSSHKIRNLLIGVVGVLFLGFYTLIWARFLGMI